MSLPLVVALAFAQVPPPSPDDPEEDAVIVVYGDDAIRQARDRVVARLEPLGWRPVDKGDVVVFRPPRWWLGRARLYDDGRFVFGRALAPLQGADVGAAGMPGDWGARDLPARTCADTAPALETRIHRGHIPGLDGEHRVRFAIYEAADAEEPVWSETQTLRFADGAYIAILGHQNPLTDLDLTDRSYWIAARVDDAPVQPRVPFDAVTARTPSGPAAVCAPAPAAFDPFPEQMPAPSFVASTGGTLAPSRRRRHRHRQAALDAIAEPLRAYRAVIAETALQERLTALPDLLDAVWREGTPLYGDAPLATPAERREVILRLWATRADNRHGRAISEAIEAWLADAVLPSEHPITDEEYALWESLRADGRTLPRP